MAKKKIYVGNEYKKAFESICRLIEEKCLGKLDYRVEGNVICTDVYEYELSGEESARSAEEKMGFTEKGATWFRALRGEHADNDSALWMSFMNNVKNAYHKEYSVVEHTQPPMSAEELQKAQQTAQKAADTFLEIFYPDHRANVVLSYAKDQGEKEDIYGVAMRIELSAAVTRGAPLPVLCKVYFHSNGNNIRPLNADVAALVEASIATLVKDKSEAETDEMASGVIDTALDAINKMIRDPERHYEGYTTFSDYLCYSDTADKQALENLRRQMSHDSFELECHRVDILYITHVRCDAVLYDLCEAGMPLFRLSLGLNNSISLCCLNCSGEEYLVDRNQICYEVDGEEKHVLLDPEKPRLGLSDEEINEIRTYSKISQHILHVACPENHRNPGCTAIKCASQLRDLLQPDGTRLRRCMSCPYPEVVYTDKKGEHLHTPGLIFLQNAMELLPLGEVKAVACKQCGRLFDEEVLHDGKCNLCVCTDRPVVEEEKKRYREYRTMLPLAVRMMPPFADRQCVEDEELILFRLGQKKYAFHKLNLTDNGYMEKPNRIG